MSFVARAATGFLAGLIVTAIIVVPLATVAMLVKVNVRTLRNLNHTNVGLLFSVVGWTIALGLCGALIAIQMSKDAELPEMLYLGSILGLLFGPITGSLSLPSHCGSPQSRDNISYS